jgi:hypothetical protein
MALLMNAKQPLPPRAASTMGATCGMACIAPNTLVCMALVKSLARRRRQRIALRKYAGYVEGDVDLFAVQQPGQAADAGGLCHVQPQGLGAQAFEALQALVIARGGDDIRAVREVLADKFKADAA